MPLERFLRSTSAKLTALFAGLLVLSFVLAGAGAWFATRSVVEHQIRQRIQLEMNALQLELRREGISAAVAAIAARAESPGALDYQLSDRNGHVLIGDLRARRLPQGWSVIDLPDDERREASVEDFVVLTQATPDGGRLAIGDDLAQARHVRIAVLQAIFWVGAAALGFALLAGAFVSYRALGKVDTLSRAIARVSAGDLAARVPDGTGDDDIDVIGRGVNAMLTRIDRLVANLRRVSTDIAHDLRTPLSHVRQALETAATADPAAAQEAIRTAQDKCDDMLRIFSAMLRLAEIDAGAARSRFTQLDLAAVAERTADAYRGDIEAGGRVLTLGPLQAAIVQGDSDLIAQAIANLIENAMRHTPPGARIAVQVTHEHGQIRLAVADNGAGVSAADRARIVEPFVRTDNARSSPGAGLGLSIVQAIARLHGAQFSLEDAAPGLRAVLVWTPPAH